MQNAARRDRRTKHLVLLDRHLPGRGDGPRAAIALISCAALGFCLLFSHAGADDEFRVFPKLGHQANSIRGTFASDGTIFATVGPEKVVVWRTADRKILTTFNHHTDRLAGISFVPGTKTLCSLDRAGLLLVQDAPTGRLLGSAQCEPAVLHGVSASPRGTYVAVVSKRVLKVLDLQTGQTVMNAPSAGEVRALHWDGTERGFWLSTSSVPLARVRVREKRRDVLIRKGSTLAACVLTGGQYFARTTEAGEDRGRRVEVWDMRSAKRIWSRRPPSATTERADRTGGMVAVKGGAFLLSGAEGIYRGSPGRRPFTQIADSCERQTHLAIDAKERFLLGTGQPHPVVCTLATGDGAVIGPAPLQVARTDRLSMAAVEGDAGLSLYLFADRWHLRWDLDTCRMICIREEPPFPVRFLTDGTFYEAALLTGGGDQRRESIVRRVRDRKRLCRVRIDADLTGPRLLSEDRSTIYLTGPARSVLLHTATGEQVKLTDASYPAAFSATGELLYCDAARASEKEERGILVFDASTGEQVKRIPFDPSLDRNVTASLTNGLDLYVVSSQRELQVRRLPANDLLCRIQSEPPYLFHQRTPIDLSPQGDYVLFVEQQRETDRFRLGAASIRAGRRLWRADLGASPPRASAFSPSGRTLFVALEDGEIRLLDTRVGTRLVSMVSMNPNHHVVYTPDGYYAAISTASAASQHATLASALRAPASARQSPALSTAEAAEYIQVWTVKPRPRAVPPTAHPARNSFERVIDAVRAAE